MAKMVSSVVVQETANKIISGLVRKFEGKEKSNSKEDMERLEMAHIKLEAALEISNKWLITDAPLLRWRKKLKLTAQECDEALQKCRQRILEEEQIEEEVRNSTFPKRMAHATTSFIFSAFGSNKDELSRSIVRRFEWFADGASEFLRFIEFAGRPRGQMSANSMIKHLFAGDELHHTIIGENKRPLFLLSVLPCRNAEHGIEASMMFIRKDGNAPENDFFLTIMLQISESTDIIGTTIKCLQLLYTLHFKSTVESIRNELIQLPTHDLSWVPYAALCKKEHWDNLYNFSTRWFRPNPLCCKQHEQHKFCHSSKAGSSGLQDVYLDSVVEVNLQCQVSLSEYNKQRTSMFEGNYSMQDPPYLKVGLLYLPHVHDSSEDLLPADRTSAVVMIDGEKQHRLHTDVTLEQVEEMMLPKAIDHFCQNTDATAYQMLWRSRSGTSYIQVEKESIFMPRTRRTFQHGRTKRKQFHPSDNQELGNLTHVIAHFVELWGRHAPIQLQPSIMDWFRKEKEKQLVPQPLRLKSRPCTIDRSGEEAEVKMEKESGVITEN